MTKFYDVYMHCRTIPSDINEHLEFLYNMGKEVNHITEFGVGYGKSTLAFFAAVEETGGTLHSYEIKSRDVILSIPERKNYNHQEELAVLSKIETAFNMARDAGLNVTLHLQDSLAHDIEETDLLLVDSHHTFNHVLAELTKHGDKVRKYIIFHDTETYGLSGQEKGSVGIWPAINQWMDGHPEWKIKEQYYNCNGLLVIERI